MSRKDYLTQKKAMSGNTRSFALNHSKRRWNLNLQQVKVILPSGQIKKINVSAKTLKTLRKKKIIGIKKAPIVRKPIKSVDNVPNGNDIKKPKK